MSIQVKLKKCKGYGHIEPHVGYLFSNGRCKDCNALWVRDNKPETLLSNKRTEIKPNPYKSKKTIIRRTSKINTYGSSDGNRWTTGAIDTKVSIAKFNKREKMRDDYHHIFCESCGINESEDRIDCSHLVSVKEAKDSGRCEIAWDVNDIVMECRNKCHPITEKQSKVEREQRYLENIIQNTKLR